MKKTASIWSENKAQVILISLTLFVSATLISDFRTTLFPACYANPDSIYSMIIRGICLSVISFFLVQFLLHRDAYMQHFKNIVCEKKQPVYTAIRIALFAALSRFALLMVFPFNTEYAPAFLFIWIVLTAAIVFPLIIIATSYTGKK